jgi:hypothetical protein
MRSRGYFVYLQPVEEASCSCMPILFIVWTRLQHFSLDVRGSGLSGHGQDCVATQHHARDETDEQHL